MRTKRAACVITTSTRRSVSRYLRIISSQGEIWYVSRCTRARSSVRVHHADGKDKIEYMYIYLQLNYKASVNLEQKLISVFPLGRFCMVFTYSLSYHDVSTDVVSANNEVDGEPTY